MGKEKTKIMMRIVWGLVGEFVNKLSPLLITMIATRALMKNQYGLSQGFLWLLDIVLFLISFGVPEYLAIYIAEQADKIEQRKLISRLISQGVVIRLVVALVMSAVLIFNQQFVTSVMPVEISLGVVFVVCVGMISSVFDMSYIFVATNQLHKLYKQGVIIRLIVLVLCVLSVQDEGDHVAFMFLSTGLNALISLTGFFYVQKKYGLSWVKWNELRLCFSNIWYFMPRALLLVFVERMDVFALLLYNREQDLVSSVGAFRIAQILHPILLIGSSVLYSDFISRKMHINDHEKEKLRYVVWHLFWLLAISLPFMGVMYFFGEWFLVTLFGDSFANRAGHTNILPFMATVGIVIINLIGVLTQQVFIPSRHYRLLGWSCGAMIMFCLASIYFLGDVENILTMSGQFLYVKSGIGLVFILSAGIILFLAKNQKLIKS